MSYAPFLQSPASPARGSGYLQILPDRPNLCLLHRLLGSVLELSMPNRQSHLALLASLFYEAGNCQEYQELHPQTLNMLSHAAKVGGECRYRAV